MTSWGSGAGALGSLGHLGLDAEGGLLVLPLPAGSVCLSDEGVSQSQGDMAWTRKGHLPCLGPGAVLSWEIGRPGGAQA